MLSDFSFKLSHPKRKLAAINTLSLSSLSPNLSAIALCVRLLMTICPGRTSAGAQGAERRVESRERETGGREKERAGGGRDSEERTV